MQRGGNGLGWSIAAEHMALQHAGVLIIGYEGKVPAGEQDPTATIKPKHGGGRGRREDTGYGAKKSETDRPMWTLLGMWELLLAMRVDFWPQQHQHNGWENDDSIKHKIVV